MLTRPDIYRQIAADQITPIQEYVTVDYDNAQQALLGFRLGAAHYEVLEALGVYREWGADPSVLHLVRTTAGVFALYLDVEEVSTAATAIRGSWVLHYRVDEPEPVLSEAEGEDEMLVDMKLKRIADFHGHLCPELVIGYRATLYAQKRLLLNLVDTSDLRVIAENTTSAVDAVQHLTGCTFGNGRLVALDYGKHAYTFLPGEGPGLRLALKEAALPSTAFIALETRLQGPQVTLRDTAAYQARLDERIATLLRLADEVLWDSRPALAEWLPPVPVSALVPCRRCGELVAPPHLIQTQGEALCRPCALLSAAARATDP
jgi:formylmethanofuran dehydrogenase subunit E